MADDNLPLEIRAGLNPSADVLEKIAIFFKHFNPIEKENGLKYLLLLDKRSNAFYINCHIYSNTLVSNADLDAVIDPQESEDYKLNRDLYTDNYAYKLMEDDAKRERSFEDLVVEFDIQYRPETPLKVFGGQHRIKAISAALHEGVISVHGVRIYFGLSIDQRVNLAIVNNTSIAVSNDLLDRMQEDLIGTQLRNWCQNVGLLSEGQNFVDKRSPEGIPTVRIARTLIVNYYLGKESSDDGIHEPIVCLSGPKMDENYRAVREKIDWNDPNLKRMGEEFAKLHHLQRDRVLHRTRDKYIEFANKVLHPSITAAWAYAAGIYQKNPPILEKHYALANTGDSGDPLNAKALQEARLKGVDSDSYRGLGSRISGGELGRALELFIIQATKASERGINIKLANAAIKSFEAKKAKHAADEALNGI
ncbi:MAG: hypothetical protein ABSG28_09260 [Methanoregula sp.]|jgi:hypothetical protein|uniref:hypothetical protein n=1 Tax=Methanoregula sp. TaxID=2052170 RepID=UPI003C2822AD